MRIDRLHQIEQYMLRYKTATMKQLSDQFNVSINTIRRDIQQMVSSGRLSKVHGGVMINQNDTTVPFTDRSSVGTSEKQLIGQMAAQIVNPGDTIYVDSGTTTVELIPHLSGIHNLTVVSNSLIVFNRLLELFDINMIAIGGQFSRKTMSYSGPIAVNSLKDIRINKAFMSATGVSIAAGATNYSLYESEVKRTAVSRSEEIILLSDHSKFGKSAPICFCPLEEIDILITDQKPEKLISDFCRRNSIDLRY